MHIVGLSLLFGRHISLEISVNNPFPVTVALVTAVLGSGDSCLGLW